MSIVESTCCSLLFEQGLEDILSPDPSKQLQGLSYIFQVACTGPQPPLRAIVSLLIRPDIHRTVKLLTYHVLKYCRSFNESEIWESVFHVIKKDIENRDHQDLQIAAIKTISALPFRIVVQKLRTGDLVLWGKDPLLLRSSVRAAFLEASAFQLQHNTNLLADPILPINGWAEVCRCLLDTSSRVVSLAFQTIHRLIQISRGAQPDLSSDHLIDLSSTLRDCCELIAKFANSNLSVIYKSFQRLHPSQRIISLRPFAALLNFAVQTQIIDPASMSAVGLISSTQSSISFSNILESTISSLSPLLHSLDIATASETCSIFFELAPFISYSNTLYSRLCLPLFSILSLPIDAVSLEFKLRIISQLTPLLVHCENAEIQFDALLKIFSHVRSIPVLQNRLQSLFSFFSHLIQLTLRSYGVSLSDAALPPSLLIDRFMNDPRVRNILTQPESDFSSEIPLFRKDFLVALLTCLFLHFEPQSPPFIQSLSSPNPPLTPSTPTHQMLDIAVRTFIRTVPCIHWKFNDSSIPIELYIKLMSLLFQIFLHRVGTVVPSPALKSKFFSFIVGGIGSINFLREVPSLALLLRLISLFASYSPLLIEATSSGQKSLAVKAQELPLKLLQLIDSLVIPNSSMFTPVTPDLVLPLIDTIASLARDSSTASLALSFIEKLSNNPILNTSHRRLCSQLVSNLQSHSVNIPQTPRPSTHQVSLRNSPRDLHYFLASQLFQSNAEDLQSITATSLCFQRKNMKYWTASGSSDPVLVEVAALANLQFQRLTIFLKISNTTNLKLTDLSVVIQSGGQLSPSSENFFPVSALGFRQSIDLKIPIHVSGLINNSVQVVVMFRASSSDLDTVTPVDARVLSCTPFIPSLSLFLHTFRFPPGDYTNFWLKLAPAFHLDATLGDIDPPAFIEMLSQTTSFPCIYRDPTSQSSARPSNIFGFASVSWFADQLAFVAMFNKNSSSGSWTMRIHARASNPRLFDSFQYFLRSSLQSLPRSIFTLVESGQQKEQFVYFETFLPFED